MKLITAQILANEAAARFKTMHTGAAGCYGFGPDGWRTGTTYLPPGAASYADTHVALVALGPTPKPDDVARLVNPSWVQAPWCECCGNRKFPAVEMCEIDGQPSNICESCARAVVEVFDESARRGGG